MSMLMGIGHSSVKKTIVIKNVDGTTAARISVTKPGKKKTKRLRYNFKEISNQILRTKTSGSAKQVIAKARRKASMLRRKLKGGEYDDKELELAIRHAEKMVKIAKKKMKHLQQEESVKKGDKIQQMEQSWEDEAIHPEDIINQEDLELDMEEIKELIEELRDVLEEMQDENGLEDIMEAVPKEMEPADLEMLKKKHRSDELREIMEADMKYLKAFFSMLEKERQEGSGGTGSSGASSGVALELSGMEVPVAAAPVPVSVEGGSIDVSV